MMWGRDFHDPAFVAQWKEHLKSIDREWIDQSPDCNYPFDLNFSVYFINLDYRSFISLVFCDNNIANPIIIKIIRIQKKYD